MIHKKKYLDIMGGGNLKKFTIFFHIDKSNNISQLDEEIIVNSGDTIFSLDASDKIPKVYLLEDPNWRLKRTDREKIIKI